MVPVAHLEEVKASFWCKVLMFYWLQVVKKAGVIIKPIQYEDMNVRERAEIHKHNGQRQRKAKDKNQSMRKKAAKV